VTSTYYLTPDGVPVTAAAIGDGASVTVLLIGDPGTRELRDEIERDIRRQHKEHLRQAARELTAGPVHPVVQLPVAQKGNGHGRELDRDHESR
jgi:hypothetical protein